MSASTPRLKLAELPEGQAMNAAEINAVLGQLDALVDCCLKGVFVDASPMGASDGDIYLVGGSPSGDWGAAFTYKLAYRRDGGWADPVEPFNGLRAFVPDTGRLLVYGDGIWTDWTSLIGAAEDSIASAATCDIGAAASLFLAVTGTTAITGFGTAANRLRFLRFADALTLTHNATSLVLPGGANIVTAAGDTALFASDGGGNWRCRGYNRAHGGAAIATGVTGSGNMVLSDSPSLTGNVVSAGGIGIGVSPTYRFHVYNAAPQSIAINNSAAGTNGGGVWAVGIGSGATIDGSFGNYSAIMGGSASHDVMVSSEATGLYLRTGNASPIIFYPSNTEAGRVGADGSLLWGTTANGGWASSAKAEMRSQGDALSVYSTGSSGGAALLVRVDNTANIFSKLFYGATQVGTITTNGSATAYNTTSDARLKHVPDVQADYHGAIRALWVGDFTWKDSGAPGFGVLAQQAYAVMPNQQGVTRPAEEAGPWQASAEPFAHLALWGVKDIYALVETLAGRIAALEVAHAAG